MPASSTRRSSPSARSTPWHARPRCWTSGKRASSIPPCAASAAFCSALNTGEKHTFSTVQPRRIRPSRVETHAPVLVVERDQVDFDCARHVTGPVPVAGVDLRQREASREDREALVDQPVIVDEPADVTPQSRGITVSGQRTGELSVRAARTARKEVQYRDATPLDLTKEPGVGLLGQGARARGARHLARRRTKLPWQAILCLR